MAKKLIAHTKRTSPSLAVPDEPQVVSAPGAVREYDLVGDVVFEPPLTPEERHRRGVGVSIEDRLEQIRRRLANAAEQP
jgi:hypothetical protein